MALLNTASIKINSPGGGENWKVGTTHTISWTPSNLDPNWKITLYYDVGSLNSIVKEISPLITSQPWTIPNKPHNSAKIRIVCTLNGVSRYSAESNTFKISVQS
jgi:hypothetical protein